MKTFSKLFLIFVLFVQVSAQQTNWDAYYSSAQPYNGTDLQNALYKIIKGQKKLPYSSSSSMDVWDALKKTDQDTTDASNVILFYTGWKRNAAAEYNGGSGWNREHVWPKSHGFPSKSDTAYTDIHHLRPADVSVNSARGSKDFDNGGEEYIDPDGDTGCKTDADSWEPRDAVKGDVARIVFYMATRYQGFGGYDLQLVDYSGTSGSMLGKLSTLLKWNRLDPPDDYERHRNEVIYSIQNNRNPFIDHPEFADRIYLSDGFIIEKVEEDASALDAVIVYFNDKPDSLTAIDVNNYFVNKGVGNPVQAIPYFNDNEKCVKLVFNFPANVPKDVYLNISISNLTAHGKKIADGSIASFYHFAFADVELNVFNARLSNNEVKLFWSLKENGETTGYEIERRQENSPDWVNAGFVKARNNGTAPASYTFSDFPQLQNGIYFYRLKAVYKNGAYDYSKTVSVNTGLPSTITLYQNYPNPFPAVGGTSAPATTIKYSIPAVGTAHELSLQTQLIVYDILGRKVATLVNKAQNPGNYSVQFNAENLPAGIYFYRLTYGNYSVVRKMILVK